MIISLDQLVVSKTYSYAHYLKWQFDERVELIKGKLFKMSLAFSRRHQKIASLFHGRLYQFLSSKSCQLYFAPFNVRLTPRKSENSQKIHTVVQFDICVICDQSKLDDRGAIGAPDLIIEILSPGNSQTEMKNKFEVYEENGVLEYWIVDQAKEAVWAYILNDMGKYIGLHPFTLEDELTSHVFPGFKLNVSDIFKD